MSYLRSGKMEILKESIIEACFGCSRIVQNEQDQVCKVYIVPKAMWKNRNCIMATHIKKEAIEEKMMDPLKASKRSMGKK
jgi:hypothetical protein